MYKSINFKGIEPNIYLVNYIVDIILIFVYIYKIKIPIFSVKN